MFRCKKIVCVVLLLISCVSNIKAGELILQNQDRLKGELSAINQNNIVWLSDLIGVVTIEKQHVKSMSSSVPLRMLGEKSLCYWQALEDTDALIQCRGGRQQRIAFSSLKDVLLSEGYAQSAHNYQGKLVAVGSKADGNRTRQDWLVDVDVSLRHFEYRHIVGLKYDAEAVNKGDLREEFEVTYSLDWFFSQRTFLFAESSAQKDEVRGIDERYSLGSGVGYQFWDTGQTALSLRTSLEYVDEQLEEEMQDRPGDFFSWRLATNYRYLLPGNIAFFLNADYLQSIRIGDEWEVEAETGVSLPIAGGITADVKYDYDFDNVATEGLVQEDTTLRFGVGYQW